jgi:hypothetical protein
MKKIFLIYCLLSVFSCHNNKKADTEDVLINPNLVFDGSNLIDKNRNGRIICRLNKKVSLPKNYNFNDNVDLYTFLQKDKSLNIKNINILKNQVPFSLYCDGLNNLLNADKLNSDTIILYDITYNKIKTCTSIAEYSFIKESDLLQAFQIFYNYSVYLRNLRRDEYIFRCSELFDDMFYFVTIKGNKLYLISDAYHYHYPLPNYNVESEIKTNSDIVMDDVYMLINSPAGANLQSVPVTK